jgi:hypothetical protein
VVLQPENPAEFGGRVYEMMGVALASKRKTDEKPTNSNPSNISSEEEKVATGS